jgi:uroporphyrinogen decarboxylase
MPQTPREVVDGLLRNTTYERVGLMGSPWWDTMVLWTKHGYPMESKHKQPGDFRWDAQDGRSVTVEEAGVYEDPVADWRHFGYDMVGVGPWFDIMPIRNYNELLVETDEWDVRRNGAGAALKYWKHKMGTPEHIDFLMTSREIWERDYRPHLETFDPDRVDVERCKASMAAARAEDRWVHFGHMFIWELMRQSMGDVVMYESLLLDPDWIHDYNRVYTDFYKAAFTYMFEEIGLPDGIWLYEDLGYKNGLFASPKVFQELIFPYYAELVDMFHSYDLPVVFHSCGSTAAALDMIVEAGFDALNPMERKALNNEPFTFAETHGDELAFVGGLDVRHLESNDPERVRREVADYVEGMKARGARVVFAEDHSLPPTVHYDTYQLALEVYREHMWY